MPDLVGCICDLVGLEKFAWWAEILLRWGIYGSIKSSSLAERACSNVSKVLSKDKPVRNATYCLARRALENP